MNTGTTTEREYVNKEQDWETRYSKGKKWRKGYNGNRRFDDGGELEFKSAEEYFASLDYSLLPSEFADYVESEILTDPELNTLSLNDPIFIELMERVSAYAPIATDDTEETMEAISLLESLAEVQEGEEKAETLEAIELLKVLLPN
jgi:hypothetical protein